MKKKLIIIIPLLITALAFILVYRYYNKEDKTTTLTVKEKRWVEENKERKFDFEVINDYPLYGLQGSGVIFDFLKDFEETIKIEFHKTPYFKTSTPLTDGFRVRILNNSEKLGKNDLLLFNDNYVAIAKNYQRINHIKDMKNLVFGVLKEDLEEVSFYLKSGTNISYVSYDKIEDLYNSLNEGNINMLIVPNTMYLNYIIEKDKYYITYSFTELKKQVVLTLSDNNETLNNIVTKYYNKWRQTNYIKEYNAAYLSYYLEKNNISDSDKSVLVSKTYTYGYIDNPPYEQKVHGEIAGIAGEYINRMSRLANINFKYKKYPNQKALQKAISNKEVDLYFDYYGYSNDNYLETNSPFIEDYVVLAKEGNDIVNSFESLKGQEIAMIKDNSLYNYFSNNSRADIKVFKDTKDLVKNSGNRILIIDKEIYTYYQNSIFKKYKLLYTDTMMSDYKFMIKKNNQVFYDLFNYIISTNSYYNYRNEGIANLKASILESSTLEQLYIIVLSIIFIPLILLSVIYLFIRKKKQIKKVKTTDRHKYTDMLTSLKNRNYLNVKMKEWEDCEVFPQAVVVLDLRNVKYVNDNYGHEEGDQLIIKAASILVNTQLENSEIIRTDGNEFLIYLIGYSEKQITAYTKKLNKEMKNLPHQFGAALGFSMINDEIKTIDDAINEATVEMITNKEDNR